MKSDFLKKYGFYISLSLFSLAYLVFMICFSGVRSLWYDDIYQIYFSWNRPLLDSLKTVLKVDLNPPLWAFISYLWLKIAPYGTVWLKLPSMVMVAMSVFTVGLAGKEAFNKKIGAFAAFLFAMSPLVTLDCAYSFRAYGLYMFASTFIVYAYVKKLKDPNVKNRIIFAVAVFLIAFTHYFGALLCVFLGISDLILAIVKKQPKSFFIEYVAVASVELLWFIPQLTTIGSALSSFWPSRPTVLSYFKAFKVILYDSWIAFAVFALAFLFFIYYIIITVKNKNGHSLLFDSKEYTKIIFILIPILYILLIFVYSNLKPESSVWVERYFFSLYPMLILFISVNMVEIGDRLLERIKLSSIVNASAVIILAAIITFNYSNTVITKVKKEYEPFEQVAEFVMSQPEIKSGDDVLIINTTNCGVGWNYYLFKNNTVDMQNVHTMDLLSYSSSEILKHDVIFLYAVHFDGSFSLDEIREEISQTHYEEILDVKRNVYKYVRIK